MDTTEKAGKEFLKYLERNRISLEGLTTDQLRYIYNNEFQRYQEKVAARQTFYSFNYIMDRLFKDGQLHSREGILHLGPLIYSQGVKITKQQKRNKEKSTVRENSPKYFPREWRNSRVKAVDQRLTFGKILPSNHSSPNDAQQNGEGSSDNDPQRRDNSHRQNKFVFKSGNIYSCKPCKAHRISEYDIKIHLKGRRHMVNVLNLELRYNRKELMNDKHGVVFKSEDCKTRSGIFVIHVEKSEEKIVTIQILNKGDSDIEILRWEILKPIREFEVEFSSTDDKDVIREMYISVASKFVGDFNTVIGFLFDRNGEHFHVAKRLQLCCRSDVTRMLGPTAPYTPKQSIVLEEKDTEKVPGLPPPRSTSDELKNEIKLERYAVLTFMRKIINKGLKTKGLSEAEKLEVNQIRQMLVERVNQETYVRKFQMLIYLEEVQMEVDIREYDMRGVSMKEFSENKRLVVLKVPGLSENRPSVLRGDYLFARVNTNGTLSKKEYQGYVHEVRQEEVVLGFSEQLMRTFIENMKFNVEFVFNRLPIRLQHRALEMTKRGTVNDTLFPSTICTRGTHSIDPLRLYNRQIESNQEQLTAIQNIVFGTSRPAPYIVYGPPGTGKTVTIVEAMMQIWKSFGNSRVLACTPSNSAADLLAQRLLKFGMKKSHILRLYASSRQWTAIPEDIKEISNFDCITRQHLYTKKEDVKEYRVVVCTLVTAGRLVSANFEPGHFSHIFVDESGHAVEPECLIPIAGLADENLQIVLAGDPQQLGPVIRSPFANECGLGTSFLERLMTTCDIYKPTKGGENQPLVYNNKVITKLLRNYRSHPDIINIPNQLFYDNELEYCADVLIRECFCCWKDLPRKGFPVIFHGVIGEDKREERSPSFFNAVEAGVVLDYVDKILKKKEGVRVKEKDIGIITPYRKQVQKIRNGLARKKIRDITVGSVEEFQGQEKLVIIVSIVRSNPFYLESDQKFDLGFVENPKRFNVTLTRAKSLLIVVGNPYIFEDDKYWVRFLNFCEQKGGYQGVDRKTKVEDIIERFNSIHLPTGEKDYIEEKPWRADM